MSELVSANEAAHRFGLSEKTVRRWIAAGKLNADKVGRAYQVSLSEVAALTVQRTPDRAEPSADTVRTADSGSAPSTADSRSGMSGIGELVALVDRLHAEARQHAATAAMWQERAGTLADRLAAAESQLLALVSPESPLVASGVTEPPDLTPEPFWTRSPRGWIAGAATVLAIVAALVLLVWP